MIHRILTALQDLPAPPIHQPVSTAAIKAEKNERRINPCQTFKT